MDRSKFVAIVTGAIAIVLSLAYLLMVQILDLRTEMVPAPFGLIADQPQITGVSEFLVGLLSLVR